jgi:hypothetical protein
LGREGLFLEIPDPENPVTLTMTEPSTELFIQPMKQRLTSTQRLTVLNSQHDNPFDSANAMGTTLNAEGSDRSATSATTATGSQDNHR